MEQPNCKSGKKPFQTEGEAITFEINNRAKFAGEQQHPYLCQDCGFHHLSHLEGGDMTRARVNYDNLGKYQVRARRSPEEMLELQRKVREMTMNGAAAKDIAERLGIDIQLVYNIRNGKASGINTTVQGIEEKQLSIQEQIAKLQRDLQLEEERKKLIIEMRELKVMWSEDINGELMLVLTQNQNRFTITHEDANKLYKQLGERLAEVGDTKGATN